MIKKKYFSRKAFTLSEVLIALVIIGVIAAITIPLLHANYLEQERKSRVKKAYSTLANAMTRVKADGGDMVFGSEMNDSSQTVFSWFDTYLKPYLNTTKICYNKSGCWNQNKTKALNGNVLSNAHANGLGSPIVTAVLQDGTLIDIDFERGSTVRNSFGVNTEGDWALVVYFDINGVKGPNQMGKDTFLSVWTEEGFVPAYRNKTKSQIDANCKTSSTGYSCINKYLTNF